MAHMIDMSNNRANFAHVGEKGWHGLGTQLAPDATFEEWQAAAGMAWKVKRAAVRYNPNGPLEDSAPINKLRKFDDRVVLFRSDTGAPLGIVSEGYQVVQPGEALDFFKNWADLGAARLETAGCLFEGRRYFAMARMGDAVEINPGDVVLPYILLSTSADGSLATEGRDTYVRVVCNNTLSAARSVAAVYRCTHRSQFDPAKAREALENTHKGFKAFCQMARDLSRIRVSAGDSISFVTRLLQIPEATEKRPAGMTKILELFNGEAHGSNLPGVRGTGWGMLNAVTEYVDHEIRARSDDHRFASAQYSAGAALKQRAVDLLTA